MFLKSSWLSARIPFTLLTLPLFWLVLSISPNLHEWRSLWVLLITHVLLYGAVNAYVSFYDGQLKTVNGLTFRRKSSEVQLNIAIAVHTLAIVLGFVFVSMPFAVLVFVYGLVAYAGGLTGIFSNPKIIPWTIIRITQGFVATLIYYIGLNDFPVDNALQLKVLIPGVASSLIIAAFFPLSPFQTNTDAKRKFYPSITLLLIAAGLSVWFFSSYVSQVYITGVLAGFGTGVILLFQQHFSLVKWKYEASTYTVWVNWVVTLILNGYSFYVFTDYTQIFQLIQ